MVTMVDQRWSGWVGGAGWGRRNVLAIRVTRASELADVVSWFCFWSVKRRKSGSEFQRPRVVLEMGQANNQSNYQDSNSSGSSVYCMYSYVLFDLRTCGTRDYRLAARVLLAATCRYAVELARSRRDDAQQRVWFLLYPAFRFLDSLCGV